MFVLVSAATTANLEPVDGRAPVDGELVVPVLLGCDHADPCTCHRAWRGVMSDGATPAAVVARRPGIGRDQLRAAIGAMLERNGLVDADGPRAIETQVERYVDEHLRAVSRILCEHGVGTVLARNGDAVTAVDVTEAA